MCHKSERNQSIDFAKGFGILLVVLNHCYYSNTLIGKYSHSFMLPLFFVASGVLASQHPARSFKDDFRRKCRDRMVPYFFFELPYMLWYIVFVYVVDHEPALSSLTYCVTLTVQFLGCTVTWFLPCMFVAQIVFSCIRRIPYLSVRALIATGVYVLGTWSPLGGMWVVLERGFVGCFFICIGYELHDFFTQKQRWYHVATAAVVFAMSATINSCTSLHDTCYGNAGLFALSGASGSYLTVWAGAISGWTDCLKKVSSFVSYVGENSLIVLGTHYIFMEAIRMLDYVFFGNVFPTLGIWEGPILGTIVMCCVFPVIKPIKKILMRLTRTLFRRNSLTNA